MAAFLELLRKHPELALFICLAAGYWVGNLKYGRFSLGTVVGTLLMGFIVGQAHVAVPTFVNTLFFALFMFSMGYKVGPQFFTGLRHGGVQSLILTVTFAFVALATAIVLVRFFHFDHGFAGGLVSGALTQSSVIGTATDAINRLALDEETRNRLVAHVPVADAVTYLFGTAGVALFLSKIAPRMIRADLKKECEQMEADLEGSGGGKTGDTSQVFASIDLQAFRMVEPNFLGKTVEQLEAGVGGRIFVQRVRYGRRVVRPSRRYAFGKDDIVVLSGKRDELLKAQPQLGPQVVDQEALEVPFETLRVIVTNRSLSGRTIAEIRRQAGEHAQGIFVRSLTRQGQALPLLPGTRVERGDVAEIIGRREDLDRAANLLGYAVRNLERSDLVYMSLAIVVGVLLGIVTIVVGKIPVSLGTGGGVLVAGLAFGWFHSVRPQFGRIPEPAVWLMETLGLNVFVACVGLAAGPHAFEAMKSNGLQLLLAGVILSLVPHLVTLLVGRYVMRLNAGLLLGTLAGAGTATASLQAISDEADSSVPALAFTVPYALNNVLLTIWGPVIVGLSGA